MQTLYGLTTVIVDESLPSPRGIEILVGPPPTEEEIDAIRKAYERAFLGPNQTPIVVQFGER